MILCDMNFIKFSYEIYYHNILYFRVGKKIIIKFIMDTCIYINL